MKIMLNFLLLFLISIVLAVSSISMLLGNQLSNSIEIPHNTYTGSGFRIDYPIGWVAIENYGMAPVSIFAPFCCGEVSVFSFNKNDLHPALTTDTLSSYIHSISLPFFNEKVTSYLPSQISGKEIDNHEAYELKYTSKLGKESFKSTELGVVIGNKAYVLIYRASADSYNLLHPIADTIMDSFQHLVSRSR
jgi:hypothetical protein